MKNRRGRQNGVALLVATVAVISMIGLMLGLFYTSMADHKQSQVNQAMIAATALAEGATEQGTRELLEASVSSLAMPTGGTFTVNGQTAVYTIAKRGDVVVGAAIEGIKSFQQQYLITSDADSNGMHKRVQKLVTVTSIPLFQFAIFYDKDLEILPGPSLTINGPVHTNGDMYLGTGSVLTLNTDYVRAVGHMYRRRNDNDAPTDGIVNIKVWGANKTEKMETKKNLTIGSISGFDSDFLGYDSNGDGDFDEKKDVASWTIGALDIWQGTVRSAEHGAIEIPAPKIETIKAFVPTAPGTGDYIYDPVTDKYVAVAPGTGDHDEGYYHDRASLTVVDNKVYQEDGAEITVWPDVDGDGTPDSPISESSFYDAREEKYVTVTNIDLSILGKSGYWPSNGLLYAYRSDATVAQPNGIRLTSADALAGPLTVASEDPVYTLGDYNVGDKVSPKQPAAIMTDAFNVLSSSWDDSKVPGEALHHAHPTDLNVAIMTGTHPTTDGSYNGGFENLPRFHEEWAGSPAEIRGSFVYAWDSEIAKGKWAYGDDRYTALSRDWDYDKDLDDPDNLPPFTPTVSTLKRVLWISR